MIRNLINALRKKRIVYVKDVTRPYEIKLQQKLRFQNQVAVVTGGSGAIGRAICVRLASEGVMVYVGGTNIERIMSVVTEIESLGFCAKPIFINLLED